MTNLLRAAPPTSAEPAAAPGPAGPTQHAARLRPASGRDVEAVRAFLAALTPATSFARFFTGLGNPPDAMVRALVEPAPGRGAWLAAPGSRGAPGPAAAGPGTGPVVGHASWVQTGGWGEISVVVADDWQGLGLGTALVAAVLADLRATSADVLRLDVLSSNRRVTAMIGRRWPGARPERDGTQLTYQVPLG